MDLSYGVWLCGVVIKIIPCITELSDSIELCNKLTSYLYKLIGCTLNAVNETRIN